MHSGGAGYHSRLVTTSPEQSAAECLGFDLLRGDLAGAFKSQLALVLVPQRGDARPVVAAHEQRQEGNRQVVVGIDGVPNDGQEERAHRELEVREPTAAAPVGRVGELYFLSAAYGIFSGAGEPGLVTNQGFDDGARVD